jgi:NADPH:quinone reductase-like Zn-dependent oxidoreductase
MKAIVCTKYGPPEVLRLAEVEKPAPKDNEVLIKIYATTATSPDCLMRSGESLLGRMIMGLKRPREKYRILGLELAGEVEAVGKDVKRFRKGDQVFGFTGFSPGAYAEYKCMSEAGSLAVKPSNMTYEEAVAAVDGATTALFFLKDKAHIKNGEKVLINGASGSMGTAAVQLAKYFGAEVTAVCSSVNIELVKSLGADKVIDYTKEDFTKNGKTYDIIFDVVSKSSFLQCKNSLKQNGRYIVTIHGMVPVIQTLWTRVVGNKRVLFTWSIDKAEALFFIRELIETGKFKAVMDSIYPLERIVEAHQFIEEGHKKGSVVVTVGHNNKI